MAVLLKFVACRCVNEIPVIQSSRKHQFSQRLREAFRIENAVGSYRRTLRRGGTLLACWRTYNSDQDARNRTGTSGRPTVKFHVYLYRTHPLEFK